MRCLLDGGVYSGGGGAFNQVNTVFTFIACTYHTIFRENSVQPPVHVTLKNVPLPIVVILLFEIYLKMQVFRFIVWFISTTMAKANSKTIINN